MTVRVLNNLWLVVVVAVACVMCSCGRHVEVVGEALGTFVQIKCYADVSEDEIVKMVRRVDTEAKASMSIFNPESLLSRINRNETDTLDEHILRNVELAGRFTQLSHGAYDITIKPLTDAWGFGRERRNSAPNVDSILQFVGCDMIAVEGNRIVKADDRVQLDLNSIAKGYVVDLVAAELEAMGIEDYMVNIGGEVRTKGVNAKGNLWTIGIETPYDGNMAQDSLEKIITLSNEAVATSGNYRRFYLTEEGAKVAHTIDPVTGYSVVSELLSVTVVAPTCAEADAAATMFMAMGSTEATLALAKECERDYGWRYYFIYADGEGYRVECSEAFY
ncbi:MAG: FAD:protein FMN transferase [Alistipes sp.]|nr:FAD:protein FMN transferase [Alistipes sp.]